MSTFPLDEKKYEKLLAINLLCNLYRENELKNPELVEKIKEVVKNYTENIGDKFLKEKPETFLISGIEDNSVNRMYDKVVSQIAKSLDLNVVYKIDENYRPQKNDLLFISDDFGLSKKMFPNKDEPTSDFNGLLSHIVQNHPHVSGTVVRLEQVNKMDRTETMQLLEALQNEKAYCNQSRESLGCPTLLLSTPNLNNLSNSFLARVTAIEIKPSPKIENISNIRKEATYYHGIKIPPNRLH